MAAKGLLYKADKKRFSIIQRLWWSSIPALLIASPLAAQSPTAAICGSVYTQTGNPASGARIQSTQNGHSLSIRADEKGRFCYWAPPGLQTLGFEDVSKAETGSYEVTAEPESMLLLTIMLQKRTAASDKGQLVGKTAEALDPWGPARILTAKQIESLPNVGHLWALLNQTDSSIVTDTFDVSGMDSDQQFLLGVRGSSWTQNQALLNGLSVTDPSGAGMLYFPDVTSMGEIIYTAGDSPTAHTGPGAHIQMIPKTGEGKLHGDAFTFFQAGALQNVNPTGRDRFFGITESDERWKYMVNSGFQLGGPVGSFPWTYFGSISIRDFEKWIRNQVLPVSASVGQETFNLSGWLSSKDQLSFYW